jgi:hypothetical protein
MSNTRRLLFFLLSLWILATAAAQMAGHHAEDGLHAMPSPVRMNHFHLT